MSEADIGCGGDRVKEWSVQTRPPTERKYPDYEDFFL